MVQSTTTSITEIPATAEESSLTGCSPCLRVSVVKSSQFALFQNRTTTPRDVTPQDVTLTFTRVG